MSGFYRPSDLRPKAFVQPEVAELAAASEQGSRALDVGCGPGAVSTYLAQQGFVVTGVDTSPATIGEAEKKAADAGVTVEFIVHDITVPGGLDGSFEVAVDMGCFHGLDAEMQRAYALELTRLTKSGSTLLMWEQNTPPEGGVAQLSPEIVEGIFAPGFVLERAEPSLRLGLFSHWYWLVRG